MAHLNAFINGCAYGLGDAKGPINPCQIVKLTADDQFEPVDAQADVAVGIFKRYDVTSSMETPGATDLNKCVVEMAIGGIYEVDSFDDTSLSAGDPLTFDASTALLKQAATAGDQVIARAISVGTRLVFQWLGVHGEEIPEA